VDNVFFTGPESRVCAPATPTDLTAIQRTSHSVRLMWTESPGATVYRVFHDGVLIEPYTFFSTLVVDGLAPGSSHVYTVLALNTAGESARSTPLTATTKPAHRFRPPAPRVVTATLRPPAIGVFLNWPAVWTATDGYNVYRNGTRIAWVYGPGFRDAIIPIGATYSYEITALNSAGESRKSVPVIVVH
jgi:hypothetical protein